MRWLGLAIAVLAVSGCTGERALVTASVISGDRLPTPLTDQPGDPLTGQMIFSARDQGHCVLCHQVSGLDVPFQGNLGPDLTDVATRLDAAQLRLRLVDYQLVRPGTVMPSYFRTHALYQVQDQYRDVPVLEAQSIEDLVAYLSTLGDEA